MEIPYEVVCVCVWAQIDPHHMRMGWGGAVASISSLSDLLICVLLQDTTHADPGLPRALHRVRQLQRSGAQRLLLVRS